MDKANPVWTISKEVGVKSPAFSMTAKNKAVPVSPGHNSSVLVSGVLLGVAQLPHSSQPEEEEGENLVHLQPVPEHEDDEGGGGGGGVPELLPKPRRKFGSITAYLSPSKQAAQPSPLPAHRTVSLPSPDSPSAQRSSSPLDRESPLSPLTPPGTRKGLLDNFRPRSKSDATCRTSKRPNFLSHLKVSPRRSVGPSSQPLPNRPMSPLAAPHQGTQLCGIRENQGADMENKEEKPVEAGEAKEGGSEEFAAARASPNSQEREQGEFRTRAASAGQQARAHVSQIVARFRQRSNSSADDKEKKKYRIVGQNRNLHLLNQDSSARGRNSSLEPETRKRTSSLSTPHRAVDVAVDPAHSAILFRDARGLPVTDPFLASISLASLEKDESQIFVKFFKFHRSYDLIPTSAKLVVFDTQLLVKKAFFALVYNGVRAAPLWDSVKQRFVGMLTITDFIRILQMNYKSPTLEMEELEEHKLSTWRDVLNDVKDLIYIHPDASLYDAIKMLIHNKIHRLPVIDQRNGNVLYILTHKRILRFLFLYIHDMPQAKYLQQSILDLKIGTYKDVEVAYEETPIIDALHKFVYKRVSALPIVDSEGRLVDIYAKFDVINLAAEKTYSNLDVTLKTANQHRNEWFEGVHKCKQDESLFAVMERIVKAEVHRLVVVDDENKVTGVISLSDILNYLVLRPGGDDPHHDYTAEEIKSKAPEAMVKTPQSQEREKNPSSSLNSLLDCGLTEAVSLLQTSTDPATPPPSPSIQIPEYSQSLLINPKQISSHLLMKSESTDSAVEATEDLLETMEEKKKEITENKIGSKSNSVSEKEEEKENLSANAAGDTQDDENKKSKTNENCDRDCKSEKLSDLAATCANGEELSDCLNFPGITIQ